MSAPRTITESEPPRDTDGRASDFWKQVNKRCRAKPGQWFKLGEFSASVATQIRNGGRPALIPADVKYDKRADYMSKHYEVGAERVNKGDRRLIKIRFLG